MSTIEILNQPSISDIIRKFNPNVFGFSKGVGGGQEWPVSYLNTAEPGKRSDDLVNQAHEMVDRMRAHPDKIDMINDWKLLTIFIGGNDMCRYCRDPVSKNPSFLSLI